MEIFKVIERTPKLDQHSYWFNDDTGEREVLIKNSHAKVLAFEPTYGWFVAEYTLRGWASVNRSSHIAAKPTHWTYLPDSPKLL